ncbi:acyltransferase family protein [Alkalihalobacterium chitinilyticum]|uniref:Acyltransferase family protein n=1 Tax=Alkalihalobacterium chitinilyticum TaxID=2980103 RepID=A0ABT5VJA3_9BACI|nr:acyltransferase family protein [Alkalihalobacterium chitinilyticum]MDE5415533.1 acyltransferase family protein [Alkalihalobacterium chitinilyticum]
MGTKEMNEVYWLRIIACLSVVLTHAVSRVITDFSLSGDLRVVYRTLQMLLLYGTPMFVLISTIVMTHAYKEKIPNGFLIKRIKYILVPYLVMATFYAGHKYIRFDWTFKDFAIELGFNFIGQWHGYFVLIIFQFYLLHLLFIKYLKRFKAMHVLIVSFIISAGYWIGFYFFFIDFVQHSSYLTLFFSRILIFGWLFYYVVAYYCGRNYEMFIDKLHRYWMVVVLGTIVSVGLVQFIYHSGMLMRVTSARFDIIPYTVMLFFLFFLLFSKLNRIPTWIVSISGYSYGIYLLHPFVQTMVRSWFPLLEITPFGYMIVQFIAGVIVPIIFIYLLSKFHLGAFIVGKTTTRKKVFRETAMSKAA